MEEIGRVREFGLDQSIVHVEIEAKGACLSCGARHLCIPTGERTMTTEAVNTRGARPGDTVRVELEPRSTVSAALLLYVLPVAALFAGYIIGFAGTGREIYGIAAGLTGLIVSFVLLRLLNPLFERSGRFKPVVVEIIQRGEEASIPGKQARESGNTT